MRLHVSDPTSFESVELDAPPESCFIASRSSRFCVVNLYLFRLVTFILQPQSEMATLDGPEVSEKDLEKYRVREHSS